MWFKEKIEKHSACIVCSEKMAMKYRQVSTLEHEGER
jgi:predicted nucleic acid-binding Zn ribbon protein